MRLFLSLSLVALSAGAAFSDTIEAVQHVTAVTVYPESAGVTREAVVQASAGLHDIMVPYLPGDIDANTIRVSAQGAVVVGTTLMTDRLPVASERSSPEIDAARAEIKRLEASQRAADAGIATLRQRARAADEAIKYLNSLALGSSATATTPTGAYEGVVLEITARLADAAKAETEAREAGVTRLELDKDLAKAQQALLNLLAEDLPVSTLMVKLDVNIDGPVKLLISSLADDSALWSPVYDLRLTRSGTKGEIAMERGLLVRQETGEDWTDVKLTLSTARPGNFYSPSTPYGRSRDIISEEDLRRENDMRQNAGGLVEPSIVVEDSGTIFFANPVRVGMTVAYEYPVPVTVRNGSDVLRLAMGDVSLSADLSAVAYPGRSDTAYLRASLKNALAEPLLPGPAFMYVDGAMAAETEMPLIVQGDEGKVWFGKIDAILVKLEEDSDQKSKSGVVIKSNEQLLSQKVTIRNLTEETWPVEALLGTTYSTNADLVVERTAEPAIDEMNVDRREGVARWSFSLETGQEQVINLRQKLSWPEGYVLR